MFMVSNNYVFVRMGELKYSTYSSSYSLCDKNVPREDGLEEGSMKRIMSPMFFVLAGVLTGVLSTGSTAEEDPLDIGAYYGGAQLCAVRGLGPKARTVRCCATATHDLVIRYRFEGPDADRTTATVQYKVICVPLEQRISSPYE